MGFPLTQRVRRRVCRFKPGTRNRLEAQRRPSDRPLIGRELPCWRCGAMAAFDDAVDKRFSRGE